jgi:hypothetical protein
MNALKPTTLALLLALSGCGQQTPQRAIPRQSYQRFVPISVSIPREPSNPTGLPWAGAFALDTKTGQLCWTYQIRENIITSESLLTLPYCNNLFKQYPD